MMERRKKENLGESQNKKFHVAEFLVFSENRA